MSISIQSKSAPRLLQDFYDYNFNGAFEDVFSPEADRGSCHHIFVKNNDRTVLPSYGSDQADESPKWSIALTCQSCRLHLDIAIDLSKAGVPCPSLPGAPLHHFSWRPPVQTPPHGSPRYYDFECNNENCNARAWFALRAPVLLPDDVAFLTSEARVRLQATPDLIPTVGHKDPLVVLRAYVQNSLDGKARRIPAVNPVFRACLGVERSELLMKLGFSFERGQAASGDDDSWMPPQPQPHDKGQLQFDKTRRILEDCREEVNILSVKSTAHMFPPPPTKKDVERILGCLDCKPCSLFWPTWRLYCTFLFDGREPLTADVIY